MGKATKEDMIRRDKLIQQKMAEGLDRNTIFREIAKVEGVSEASIKRQYYMIIADLEKLVQTDKHELRATLMARQEAIYQEAIKGKNLKTALEATNAQAKLGGLYETEANAPKQPEAIIFKEKDFSTPLQVVPTKAENE